PKVWQAETDSLVKAIETRFDGNAADTRKALKIARQLQETAIDTRLPTVTNSLQAIETLREEQARTSAPVSPTAGSAEVSAESGAGNGPGAGEAPAASQAPKAADAPAPSTSPQPNAPAAPADQPSVEPAAAAKGQG